MGIKHKAAVFLAIGWWAGAWSQPVVLPDTVKADPSALAAAIPGLACQPFPQPAQDPVHDAEFRFQLELACGRYGQASRALDDWNRRLTRATDETVEPALRLELHALAKLLESRSGISYREAFGKVLAEKFAPYDDQTATDSAWVLGLPPVAARGMLDRQLQALAGRETLSAAEWMDLLRAYNTLQAVDSYAPVLDAAIARDDERRFVIERGVLIRTRQGATIAADVVRPKRLTGPLPAVLHFTIYTNPAINLRDAKDAAVRGYAGVFANARGKYLSTDRIVPWETEVLDTWAVIDWISRQAWSDGQVGMFGHSYDGFAQWAAAKKPHPALKTIVPSGASFPGDGLPMQNNVFQNANYGWPLQVTSDRYVGDPRLQDWNRWSSLAEQWFVSGKSLRDIDAIDGTPNEILQRQLRHPSFDRYWQAMQPYARDFADIAIPVLTLTGYFDDAGSAAVNYLVEHYRHRANAEHYLVIGPWSHRTVLTSYRDRSVNGYEADPASNIDTIALVYEWFDHVLRGGAMPALLKDRINYQVMGTNSWSHAPSIAKMADRTLRLYLTDRKDGGRYALSPHVPGANGVVEQRVDLADRKSRVNLYPVSAWSDAPDAPMHLTYVSEPFDRPVELGGLITGELRVTIDRKDFDFTWSLHEATPDGRLFNLSYYLGRASYAADRTTRKPLTPGKVASLPFARSRLVGKRLAGGSRLLLQLSVNKNPFAQVNYGTGRDVSDESVADAGPPLHVRWHNDSYIDIPLRDVAARAP